MARHELDKPCPVTGKDITPESAFTGNPAQGPMIWTDHDRPGNYNACRMCTDETRTLGERLSDLNDRRKNETQPV